jgi:hypothetical protein
MNKQQTELIDTYRLYLKALVDGLWRYLDVGEADRLKNEIDHLGEYMNEAPDVAKGQRAMENMKF